MFKLLRRFASLKVTLVGMLLLGVGAGLSYGNPMNVPVWVLVLPLVLLAMNLMAAIATNQHINQQPGLLVFHLSLLSVVLLAGIGRLTHLNAHVEMLRGADFHSEQLLEVRKGPMHSGALDQVHFIQGAYTVQYGPGMRRGLTFSHVKYRDPTGKWINKVVGDDRPLLLEGYRFYTTHNKGFAPMLSWLPDNGGKTITGAVNMPSYPLFDYKQDNAWTTPAGQPLKLWLQLKTGMDENADWVLDGSKSSGVLVVTTADKKRHEMKVGDTLPLKGGVLRYDELTTWMGYRIFYDPTLHWLFFAAVTGVMGLAYYFWRKMNLQPWESPIDDKIHEVHPSVDATTTPAPMNSNDKIVCKNAMTHSMESDSVATPPLNGKVSATGMATGRRA